MDLRTVVEHLHKGRTLHLKDNSSTFLSLDEITLEHKEYIGEHYTSLLTLKHSSKQLSKYIPLEGFLITPQGIDELLHFDGTDDYIHLELRKASINNYREISSNIVKKIKQMKYSELFTVQFSKMYEQLVSKHSLKSVKITSSISNTFNIHSIFSHPTLKCTTHKKGAMHQLLLALCEYYSPKNIYQIISNSALKSFRTLLKKKTAQTTFLSIGFEPVYDTKSSGLISSCDMLFKNESIISIYSNKGYFAYCNSFTSIFSQDNYQIFKQGITSNNSAIYYQNSSTKTTYLNSQLESISLPQNIKHKKSLSEFETIALSQLLLNIEECIYTIHKKPHLITLFFSISPYNSNGVNSSNGAGIRIEGIKLEESKSHSKETIKHYELVEHKNILSKGESYGSSIVHGQVKVISTIEDLVSITPEDIVSITSDILKEGYEYVKQAKGAIIFCDIHEEKNGRKEKEYLKYELSYHQFSIPALICSSFKTSIENNLKEIKLKNNQFVTLNCSTHQGSVHNGLIKYKISQLHTQDTIKGQDKCLVFTNKTPHYMLSDTSSHSSGIIGISCFDTISKRKLECLDKKSKKEYIISQGVKYVSEVAIAHFPKKVYIQLNKYSDRISKALNHLQKNNIQFKDEVEYIFDEGYKDMLELQSQIISTVTSKIKCSNVHLLVNGIQDEKEILKLKEVLKKYSLDKLELAVNVSLGGVMMSQDIAKHVSVILCDLDELKTSFKKTNITAIVRFLHFFVNEVQSSSVTIGVSNVTSSDEEVIDMLHHLNVSLLCCPFSELFSVFSFLDELEHHSKSHHKKHKKSISL